MPPPGSVCKDRDMRKTMAVLFVIAVLGSGCGAGAPDDSRADATVKASPSASPSDAQSARPQFRRATGRLVGDGTEVELRLEVADTPERRAYGLMFRKSLPADSGMVFSFPSPTTGGFFMKNTLIPLSIAFFDSSGKILEILDMTPCTSDPCEIYEPGVSYTGALEVNQGSFARWGISVGDHVEVSK